MTHEITKLCFKFNRMVFYKNIFIGAAVPAVFRINFHFFKPSWFLFYLFEYKS